MYDILISMTKIEKFEEKRDPYLEEELLKAKEDLDSFEKWLRSTHTSEEEIKTELEERKQDLMLEIKWKYYFKGRNIPSSWDIWYNVSETFTEAAKNKEELSTDLIDAGISHPHHLVAYETGKTQRLNTRQLAYLFIRELPFWNFEEIIEAQTEKGMTDQDLEEAKKYAEEYKERLEKEKLDITKDGILAIQSKNS